MMEKYCGTGRPVPKVRLLGLFLALSLVLSPSGGSPARAQEVSGGASSSSGAGAAAAVSALAVADAASVEAEPAPSDAGSEQPSEMIPDTTGDLSLPVGMRYTFAVKGAADVEAGTPGVVAIEREFVSGGTFYCTVVACGKAGSSTGMYMSAPGQAPQKFCTVTVVPQPVYTEPTRIGWSENYDYLDKQNLKQNEMMYFELSVDDPDLSLTVTSSDESVIRVTEPQAVDGSPGHYAAALFAVGQGTATLTVTASDGTADEKRVTVEGSIDKDYTLSSDTTRDFSISRNGSYLLKLDYTYTGPTDDPTSHGVSIGSPGSPLQFPLLVSDNPNIQVVPVAQNGSEFLFRIDAFGAAGQSATLYTGSYNYMPEELCRVTIAAAPKNIRLDTSGVYRCNMGDTYTFVAYTNSPAPPAAGASNGLVRVQYVRKVAGGYEYRMTAQNPGQYASSFGSSLVRVTQNGESVSFPVEVDNTFQPTVKSDTTSVVKLYKGESYTYKFTIMGGGEPYFTSVYNAVPTTPSDPGIMSVRLVKKDGPDYYVKVTALSDRIGDESYVCIRFPHSIWYDPNRFSGYGAVQIRRDPSLPVIPMKSDTTNNFTLGQYKSYVFKITGAALFGPGTPYRFNTELIRKSGNDSYYRVTPTGGAGLQAGFYMSNGITTEKVCVITIGPFVPVVLKSDTTQDFSLAQGQSYTFKLTGATAFNPGTDGVFTTELVKRSGSDSYYKITAVGPAGSSSGFYMGVANQPAERVCTVSVAGPGAFTSDTTSDFTLPSSKSYTFKITAPGAKTVGLTAGTSPSFKVTSAKRSGSDFYFTIASALLPGQGKTSGVYVSVDGGAPKRICAVTLIP